MHYITISAHEHGRDKSILLMKLSLLKQITSYMCIFKSVLILKRLKAWLILSFLLQDIKFNCRFTGEYFEIDATDFYLEPDALLSCKGRGFKTNTTGSGIDSPTGGSGAGHATQGGNSTSNFGGDVFGSIYEPIYPGARGGSVSSVLGSRGGGRIRLKIGYAFILDGVLTVDADNAIANSGKYFLN